MEIGDILSKAVPIAAGAFLDSETTDKGQNYSGMLATPLAWIAGDDAARAAVDGARLSELTGDGKDALLKAYHDYQEGKSVGDVAGSAAHAGLGMAADYAATNASQGLLDYLDKQVLGDMIPDSAIAMLSDWLGEQVQAYVNDIGKEAPHQENPGTSPGVEIPPEAAIAAREAAPANTNGGQDVEEIAPASGGADFQRAPAKGEGMSA